MVDLSPQNPVVQSYIVYAAILAVKLSAMSLLTAITRMIRGVYMNPEDAKFSKGKVKYDDPIIERIRGAHRNDLENIPAFWVVGLLYLTTEPDVTWATLLFRVFTVSRIIHTVVYAIIPLPSPSRGIAFGVAALINVYMTLQVILNYIVAI